MCDGGRRPKVTRRRGSRARKEGGESPIDGDFLDTSVTEIQLSTQSSSRSTVVEGSGDMALVFVDALTDCHIEGRCQHGHGLAVLKACLDECDSLPQGAVWGFFNSIFSLETLSVTHKDKMLVFVLSWLARPALSGS